MILLSVEFRRRIDRLHIHSRGVFRGKFKGERRSANKGSGVEFADYRVYELGNDLRNVDWKRIRSIGSAFHQTVPCRRGPAGKYLVGLIASQWTLASQPSSRQAKQGCCRPRLHRFNRIGSSCYSCLFESCTSDSSPQRMENPNSLRCQTRLKPSMLEEKRIWRHA